MMKLHGTIPVKGYLHKYATRIENIGDNPLDLTNCGVIGFQLKLLLENKTNVNHKDKVSNNTLTKYDSALKFKIHYRWSAYNNLFISRQSIVIFNSFLYYLFHEDLLKCILRGERDGIPIKDSIFTFAEMYGIVIDEDISFEAIKKASYRLRNVKNITGFNQSAVFLPQMSNL